MGATAGNDDVWIGLNDIEREGHFKWLDGVLAANETIGWYDGEPNDSGNNEDCVHINWGGRFLLNAINDIPCSAAVHALCEKKLITDSLFFCI